MSENLEVLSGIVAVLYFFSVLINCITLLDYDYARALLSWRDVWFPGIRTARVDKRNPRSSEIIMIKSQIKALKGNISPEAIMERNQLLEELRALRQEVVYVAREVRLINDQASYELRRADIQTERELRHDRTKMISESNRTELEARRESYINTE